MTFLLIYSYRYQNILMSLLTIYLEFLILSVIIMDSIAWMLIEVLVMMLLQTIGFESTVLQNAGSFISKMFMLIFAVVIRHTIKDNHDSPIPLRYFLIILLVPASSIYIMHNIFLIANAHTEYILFSAIASFIFLIVNYVIFEIYDWIRHNAELREQNRLYIQQ